jgi:hypothetical protein
MRSTNLLQQELVIIIGSSKTSFRLGYLAVLYNIQIDIIKFKIVKNIPLGPKTPWESPYNDRRSVINSASLPFLVKYHHQRWWLDLCGCDPWKSLPRGKPRKARRHFCLDEPSCSTA